MQMPFAFHLNRVMDQPNIASLFYGPVLLAAEESEPRSDWRPVTLDAADLGKSITGNPTTLRFTIGDVAVPAVLRNVWSLLGLPGCDVEVGVAGRGACEPHLPARLPG